MLSVASVAPPRALDADVLACMGPAATSGNDPRLMAHDLRAPGEQRCELWRVAGTVRSGTEAGFRVSEGGAFLAGCIDMEESALENFVEGSRDVYQQITSLVVRRGYPHLLRCWNYIHDIHRGDGDGERYRQFCIGRHQAVAAEEGFERTLPAATVIGSRRPGMQVCFLAGKAPGVQIENPRQTPAYRYPREYGPASPSFSRAILLPEPGLLLMSGTASVVGHASQHPGDVVAQSAETVENVRALLEQAAKAAGGAGTWAPRSLRIFLRDAADVPRIRDAIEAAFGADAPLSWFEGDVCRSDLLMEIDGVFARG